MDLRELSPDHRELLDSVRDSVGGRISDYSFSYLYIHRKAYNFRAAFDPLPFAAGETPDGLKYLMPLVELNRQNISLFQEIARDTGAIFPVPEDKLPLFENSSCRIEADPADSDYIYSIEKLKYYRGRKLHGQKNLLNRFMKNHEYRAFALSVENVMSAREVLDEWDAESPLTRDETDYNYCAEALGLIEKLGLTGYIFFVNGRPGGFITGEIINGDTFTVFFSKGLRKIRGIYQFMNNYTALMMPENVNYFNFEQDMGIEGLRKSKLSYNPDYLLKKYRVIL